MPSARAYVRDESCLLRDGASESEIRHATDLLADRHAAWARPRGYLVEQADQVTVDWILGVDWNQPLDPLAFIGDTGDKPVSHLDFETARFTRVTLTGYLVEDLTGEWPSVRAALAEDGLLPALQRASERPAAPPRPWAPPEAPIGAEFRMGSTPPAHPAVGDMWFDTASSKTHVWTGAAWTPFAPASTAVDRFRDALTGE